MNSTDSCTFSNLNLQSAFDKINENLASFENTLDTISNDIKRLETKLNESKFALPVAVEISGHWDRNPSYCELYHTWSGADYKQHLLSWEQDEKSRFRLYYTCKSFDEAMCNNKGELIESNGEKIIMRRPLIECDVQTRIRMNQHLPKIVEAVGEALPNYSEILF